MTPQSPASVMPGDWKGWPLRKDYVQSDFYELKDAYRKTVHLIPLRIAESEGLCSSSSKHLTFKWCRSLLVYGVIDQLI